MSGLVLVDIALAVVFTILVVSIVASAIVETIASLFHWRAAGLQRGLRSLMGGGVDDFMSRAVIRGLSVGKRTGGETLKRKPSAMSPRIFAKESLNWLGVDLDPAAGNIREQLKAIHQREDQKSDLVSEGKAALAEKMVDILSGVADEAEKVEHAVASWFDDSIQRVGGWYRRRTRTVLFWIGFLFALSLNINLVQYAGDLLEDDARREAAAAQAIAAAQVETLSAFSEQVMAATDFSPDEVDGVKALQNQLTALKGELDKAKAQLEQSHGTLGWSTEGWPAGDEPWISEFVVWVYAQGSPWFWITGVFSWIAIAFAVTLGAQFWFDLLKSLVNVRTAGLPAAPKDGDEDKTENRVPG